MTHEGCQTNALVGYFGEVRDAPCGHCAYCLTGRAAVMPSLDDLPAPESLLDVNAWEALKASHPDALREPRQQARFLCGLTSPALARAKLSRHALFGALERLRFGMCWRGARRGSRGLGQTYRRGKEGRGKKQRRGWTPPLRARAVGEGLIPTVPLVSLLLLSSLAFARPALPPILLG